MPTSKERAVLEHFKSHRLVDKIPKRFSGIIANRIVDISGARPYYRRLADDALLRIESEIQKLGRYRYKLSAPSYLHLQYALRELLCNAVDPGAVFLENGDADSLATALFRTAWQWRLHSSEQHGIGDCTLQNSMAVWRMD